MNSDQILTILGIFGITLSGVGIGYFFARMQTNQDKLEAFLRGLESPGIHDEYDDDWDDDDDDTLTDWLWAYHPEIAIQLDKYRKDFNQFLSDPTKLVADLNKLDAQAGDIVKQPLTILNSERKQIEEESEAQKNPE